MTTTVNPEKTRSTGTTTTRTKSPRVRASAPDESDSPREAQYDLLTAALLGLAIGAGTTLLLRRGPSGSRPVAPAWRMARKGAQEGARLAGRGARYAWDRGVDAWERVPREEIEDHVREYVESARETIDHLLESELKDLRRAIRRQRKKLGI